MGQAGWRRPSSRVPKGGQARESTRETKKTARRTERRQGRDIVQARARAGAAGVGAGTRAEHVASFVQAMYFMSQGIKETHENIFHTL